MTTPPRAAARTVRLRAESTLYGEPLITFLFRRESRGITGPLASEIAMCLRRLGATEGVLRFRATAPNARTRGLQLIAVGIAEGALLVTSRLTDPRVASVGMCPRFAAYLGLTPGVARYAHLYTEDV